MLIGNSFEARPGRARFAQTRVTCPPRNTTFMFVNHAPSLSGGSGETDMPARLGAQENEKEFPQIIGVNAGSNELLLLNDLVTTRTTSVWTSPPSSRLPP